MLFKILNDLVLYIYIIRFGFNREMNNTERVLEIKKILFNYNNKK